MIRQKNRIHRKAKHFNNPMHWNKFRKIRNEVTSLFEKYILNTFALSISSNIKLSLWRIGGILISDPFIPEIFVTICSTKFQNVWSVVYINIFTIIYWITIL
jgi:hypothetical protein